MRSTCHFWWFCTITEKVTKFLVLAMPMVTRIAWLTEHKVDVAKTIAANNGGKSTQAHQGCHRGC